MNVTELIVLVQYKLSALNNARSTAASIGDVQAALAIDTEVFETEQTLNQLRTLSGE